MVKDENICLHLPCADVPDLCLGYAFAVLIPHADAIVPDTAV